MADAVENAVLYLVPRALMGTPWTSQRVWQVIAAAVPR